MSQDIPAAARSAAWAAETEEAFLVLVTIDHAQLTEPIRLTSDGVATTRSDGVYQPFPFRIVLPRAGDAGDAGATLQVDVVDRQVIGLVAALADPPAVTLEVILASDPETPIVRYPGLRWDLADYDEMTMTGTLRADDFADEPLTGDFTPSRFTALFTS